jgi:hypothetical protein
MLSSAGMAPEETPTGWGDDPITGFLEDARRNAFASYANLRPEYETVAAIDRIFGTFIDNLLNPSHWFSVLFLLQAHSSWRGAVHLAMAGQVSEAYALLRLTLEHALYGLYLSEVPTARETWLRRHDSTEAKDAVRSKFTVRRLQETLTRRDAETARVEQTLYEHCIDHGAHPNERALSQSLGMTQVDDRIDFKVSYLAGEPLPIRACLRTAAQVGACALSIFRLVYTERFDLLGVTEDLERVKRAL